MAEAGMLVGVFGIAVRAPHGIYSAAASTRKCRRLMNAILGALGGKGKLIISMLLISKNAGYS
jgi:hypothetical protein